ncbi:superoxide dismutase [Shouchella lehensis]|nr:superoxide dismutase [Shouchella lehensis]MBG9784447.1 superoxide dismutase [Shouchella lehensis]
MDTHLQAVRQWCDHLDHLWGEQQQELVNRTNRELLEQFYHARAQLHEAIVGNDPSVDQAAAVVYEVWQEMNEQCPVTLRHRSGNHVLPPLPYPYNGLEPYIDEETMRLHHQIHHKSYVDGLNKAELELVKARDTDQYELVKHWERELAFHGAGHYLHTLFWEVMAPNGGGKPAGTLLEAIEASFGSFEKMQKHFTAAAAKVEGSGWAMLVWAPRGQQLEILQAEKHQQLSQQDQIPLLVLDVWEHAYYLKHQNKREAYISDWWKVVNWKAVEERFRKAKELKWKKA